MCLELAIILRKLSQMLTIIPLLSNLVMLHNIDSPPLINIFKFFKIGETQIHLRWSLFIRNLPFLFYYLSVLLSRRILMLMWFFFFCRETLLSLRNILGVLFFSLGLWNHNLIYLAVGLYSVLQVDTFRSFLLLCKMPLLIQRLYIYMFLYFLGFLSWQSY